MIRRVAFVSLAGLIIGSTSFSSTLCQAPLKSPESVPLVIGWHDEMNDPAAWKPLGPENPPDVYASQPGLLTLRLPHVPEGYPYAYQWSGVTRSVSADLAQYPVLIARVSSLAAGSYAHLEAEERDYMGKTVRTWRSPVLTHPGLTFIDLGKEIGAEVRRLTLRLIVGGKLAGAQCEYDWVRFVRRQDVGNVQEDSDQETVQREKPVSEVCQVIETTYAQSDAAYARKDVEGAFAHLDPSWVAVDVNGKKLSSVAEERLAAKVLFPLMLSRQHTYRIEKIAVSGNKATLTVWGRTALTVLNPYNKQQKGLLVAEVSSLEEWKNDDQGWREVRSRQLSLSMTLNGRAVHP